MPGARGEQRQLMCSVYSDRDSMAFKNNPYLQAQESGGVRVTTTPELLLLLGQRASGSDRGAVPT